VAEVTKPTAWSDLRYENYLKSTTEEFESKLRNFIAGFLPRNDEARKITYSVTLHLQTDKAILEEAKKQKADFICMSTHGGGTLQKIMGSHASNMVMISPVPLLLVPARYKVKPVHSVLYASDFSDLTREIKHVKIFADAIEAKLSVYHYDYLLHVDEVRQGFEKKAAKYSDEGIEFHFRRQEIEKSLAKQMERDISSAKPGVVVMFTKQNRSWLEKLFSSGESANLTFHTKTPLLIFKKAEA
jgi:hypothetical protein